MNNQVIKHQTDSSCFLTSGISTTPKYERALYYAKNGDIKSSETGFVYKINRGLLQDYSISEYIVADFIEKPNIPEDLEIILVAQDFGILDQNIVVEIIEV